MMVLHLVLVLRRLAREGEAGAGSQEALTEAFVIDMDDNMREMTVGDLAVPRQVKRAVAVLHDRYAAYGKALAASAGRRRWRMPSGHGSAPSTARRDLDAAPICAYMRAAAQGLDGQPER